MNLMENQRIIKVTDNYGTVYITVQDFRNSSIYNPVMFDNQGVLDADVQMAINIASFNINYLSGQQINRIWNGTPPPDENWKNLIIQATLQFVRYLCTSAVDWLRGSATFSQGGTAESQTNPSDPYFVPPEVINLLKQAEVYQNTYFVNNDMPTFPKWYPQISTDGSGYITWKEAVNVFVPGNLYGQNNFKSPNESILILPQQDSNSLYMNLDVDWSKAPSASTRVQIGADVYELNPIVLNENEFMFNNPGVDNTILLKHFVYLNDGTNEFALITNSGFNWVSGAAIGGAEFGKFFALNGGYKASNVAGLIPENEWQTKSMVSAAIASEGWQPDNRTIVGDPVTKQLNVHGIASPSGFSLFNSDWFLDGYTAFSISKETAFKYIATFAAGGGDFTISFANVTRMYGGQFGDPDLLTTTNKSSLVAAINEVNSKAPLFNTNSIALVNAQYETIGVVDESSGTVITGNDLTLTIDKVTEQQNWQDNFDQSSGGQEVFFQTIATLNSEANTLMASTLWGRYNTTAITIPATANGLVIPANLLPSWFWTNGELRISGWNDADGTGSTQNRSWDVIASPLNNNWNIFPYNSVVNVGANNGGTTAQAAVTSLRLFKPSATTGDLQINLFQRTSNATGGTVPIVGENVYVMWRKVGIQ